MKAISLFLGALLGCVAGWGLVAAAAIAFGELFGSSDFEGQRAMTAVFGIGPIGGVIGLIAGVLIAWRLFRA